jgi:putative glutamine amidotransferase
MKPVIAVSAQAAVTTNEFYGEQKLTSLYDLYVRAIEAAGALPVVLAHSDPVDVPDLLERFDGLLIPGGGDIDPSSYGERPEADTLYGIRPEADAFEIALVLEAARRHIPTLGICRGLQIINVAFGGTLHQDLPEHPKDLMGRAFAGHYRTNVVRGSRLSDIVGRDEIVVNSLHHQGVKELGDGLRIAATAGDGIVESIEAAHPTWDMLAVQWHPECLRKDDAAALFGWLADTAAMRLTRVDVRLLTESVEVIAMKSRKAAAAS